MYYLCFKIKENKIAIKFVDSYKLIDKTELTYNENENKKSVHFVRCLTQLIPVFKLEEKDDVDNKSIVLIQTDEIFGVFVEDIDKIIKTKLPRGYRLLSKEEFEILIRDGRNDITSQVELF